MKIFVKVKLKSKQEKIEKIDDHAYTTWLKEIPIENKANIALIKLLAKYFKTNKSSISIISGQKSRSKIINIENILHK